MVTRTCLSPQLLATSNISGRTQLPTGIHLALPSQDWPPGSLSPFLNPSPAPWSVGRKGPDTLWARRAHGPHLPPHGSEQERGPCPLFWVPSGTWSQILQRPLPSMLSAWPLIWSTQNLPLGNPSLCSFLFLRMLRKKALLRPRIKGEKMPRARRTNP